MQTIVQDYGPIYGEVVNGTVQGRPNGSVYVPLSNTIAISVPAANGIKLLATNAYRVVSGVTMVAESQDLSSYVVFSLYSDLACTTQIGVSRTIPAGNFNSKWGDISYGNTVLTVGVDYYVRAQLMNNGVAVATSNVVTVVGE